MNTIAPSATPQINPADGGVVGAGQYTVPYGLGYSHQTIGLLARRYMHEFGVRPEQVAWLPIVEREHALMNPRAYMNSDRAGKMPLTMEDYLNSRFIAEPARLFDCDIPVNGAFAYIMTSEARAKDLRHPPVYLLAWARPDDAAGRGWEPWDGISPTAVTLYKDAGLDPRDIDLWFVYDGYSYLSLFWMEFLGLVPRGEAANYIEGGDRIRYTGEHPVNTHGGNLSEGRLHGAGHILESVNQLRGTAGLRQAKGDYAVLSMAFPPGGGCGIIGKGY
jgi:acetyl-CoA acetyltransferase